MKQPPFRIAAIVALALISIAVAAQAAWGPAEAADLSPAKGPLANPPAATPETLTAIDLPLDSLPVLERLGILHQSEPRLGFWRAAASAEQLALLINTVPGGQAANPKRHTFTRATV